MITPYQVVENSTIYLTPVINLKTTCAEGKGNSLVVCILAIPNPCMKEK